MKYFFSFFVKKEDWGAYFEGISAMKKTPKGEALSYYMDAIDTKTASLLAHVSIMMTILSIFYYKFDNSLIRYALVVELAMYLCVTLACLRGVWIFGPDGRERTTEDLINQRIREVEVRIKCYKGGLYTTFFATIAFIITLIVHNYC